MSPARTVDSTVALLEAVELTRITHYEVSGRRHASDATVEEGVRPPQVMVRKSELEIETRMRMVVETDVAVFTADISATYTLAEPAHVPDEVVTDFLERVGLMAVYPYAREAIHTSASRLAVDAPVLGLLRTGSVRIVPNGNSAPVEE